MRVDAHQHFWAIARGDYGWLTPASGPLWRDAGPERLRPHLTAARIDRTVLVQAAPTDAETAYLLDLARRTPFVAGVVGWCDLAAPDAAARVRRLAADPLLLGLRPMLQDLPERNWILRAEVAPGLAAMVENGLVLDALVRADQIGAVAELAARWPELPVVLDHGGKPDLAGGVLDRWREDIAALARHPNVVGKLSGLVTEAGADPSPARLRPAVELLLASFGAERLLFGSDWPVVELACSYAGWLAMAEAFCAGLSAAERRAVFGGNARRVYGAGGRGRWEDQTC